MGSENHNHTIVRFLIHRLGFFWKLKISKIIFESVDSVTWLSRCVHIDDIPKKSFEILE